MLAPPVESHDERHNVENHTLPSGAVNLAIVTNPAHGHGDHDLSGGNFFGGNLTAIHPKHFEIEWIRIYKNPKITKLADIWDEGDTFESGTTLPLTLTSRVIRPTGFESKPPNANNSHGRRARLFPSLWTDYKAIVDKKVKLDDVDDDYFWVDINPDTGELREDKSQSGNSGLVTATENNTVVPGDIVAIAINVKLHYYRARKEPAFGSHPKNADEERTGSLPDIGTVNYLPLARAGELHVPENNEVWARLQRQPTR